MQDKIVYTEPFQFDDKVTECFSDMINRSIPDYDTMRRLCYRIEKALLDGKEYPLIVDVGCSTGLSTYSMALQREHSAKFILLDSSEDMVKECRRFYKYYHGDMEIRQQDISREYSETDIDLILAIFTIQFTPVSERLDILKKLYDSLKPGGAIVFCEKLLCEDQATDDMFTEIYYSIKRKNGYTDEEILSKQESLRTSLYPLKYDWNIEMLKSAGFKHVSCFWRALSFAGFLGIKE